MQLKKSEQTLKHYYGKLYSKPINTIANMNVKRFVELVYFSDRDQHTFLGIELIFPTTTEITSIIYQKPTKMTNQRKSIQMIERQHPLN